MPALLALSACGAPRWLSGKPPLAPDTKALLEAVTAEASLIALYSANLATYPELGAALRPLLAEHEAHLSRLRAAVSEPPGQSVPAQATARPRASGSVRAAVAQLLSAERVSVAAQLRRLSGAAPGTAQLYASIAASEATHVAVLERTQER